LHVLGIPVLDAVCGIDTPHSVLHLLYAQRVTSSVEEVERVPAFIHHLEVQGVGESSAFDRLAVPITQVCELAYRGLREHAMPVGATERGVTCG
jgi:hypothetical protein